MVTKLDEELVATLAFVLALIAVYFLMWDARSGKSVLGALGAAVLLAGSGIGLSIYASHQPGPQGGLTKGAEILVSAISFIAALFMLFVTFRHGSSSSGTGGNAKAVGLLAFLLLSSTGIVMSLGAAGKIKL